MLKKLLAVLGTLFLMIAVVVVVVAFVSSLKRVVPGSVMSSGNEAADVQITKFWDTALTRCGDYWYAKDWLNVIEVYQIYQFQNPFMQSHKVSLTAEDKEAGIQWMGRTYLTSARYRIYEPQPPSFENGWSKWHRGTPWPGTHGGINVLVIKRNNQWEFYNDLSGFLGHGARSSQLLHGIDCNEIPN